MRTFIVTTLFSGEQDIRVKVVKAETPEAAIGAAWENYRGTFSLEERHIGPPSAYLRGRNREMHWRYIDANGGILCVHEFDPLAMLVTKGVDLTSSDEEPAKESWELDEDEQTALHSGMMDFIDICGGDEDHLAAAALRILDRYARPGGLHEDGEER